MSVNDGSAASRQFTANPPFVLSKMMSKMVGADSGRPKGTYYIVIACAAVVIYGGFYLLGRNPGWTSGSPRNVTLIVLAVVLFCLPYLRFRRRRIRICVTSEGLTVDRRRGVVFAFSEARLGLWAWSQKITGTALHLRCGPHRFVVGGRDHRPAAGARLDESPQSYVDAWLWAADFDQLLAAIRNRGALAVPQPTAGERTRALLFPNIEAIQQMSGFALGAQQRVARSTQQPCLAIELDQDQIRVIDVNSDAPVAAASLAQVTATPETYRCSRLKFGPSYKQPPPSPVLVLGLAGMQPLTIGCHEYRGFTGLAPDFRFRFSWSGHTPDRVNEPAQYSVSAGDWLLLVERFGLAQRLEDGTNPAKG